MRGLEKAAVPFAALALAGGAASAESNETPKTISSGTQLEASNRSLHSAANQVGSIIFGHKTNLKMNSPAQGEATVLFHGNRRTDQGSITIDLLAVMGITKRQPDPNKTKTVSIVNVDTDQGVHSISLGKEINLFGRNTIWRGEFCSHPKDQHRFIDHCFSTDPLSNSESKISYVDMADDAVQAANEQLMLAGENPFIGG